MDHDADLHRLHREAIQAAKAYMGEPAWGTVAFTLLILAAILGTLGSFAMGWINVWLALPVYALLTYMSYTPLHEAAHGNIHGDRDGLRWLNAACGMAMAPWIMVPYASHKLEHFTHHRHTNQPGKDPDFIVQGMGGGPWSFLKTILQFLWVQNSFFPRHHWGSASTLDRTIYALELTISLGWRVAFVAGVSQPGTVALIVIGYLIGATFTAYWFAYRPHLPYKTAARYQNTNSMLVPTWLKPLEWLWLGQNLHSIHHLFPRVPFYRYHALHRDIEPTMRAHGTPMIGIFSRQPIPAATDTPATQP